MKIKLFIFLLAVLSCNMAHAVKDIVCHDGTIFPVRVFLHGTGDSAQEDPAKCDFDPVLPSTPQAYWKRQSPGLWVAWTAQEIAAKAAFDLANSTTSTASQAVLGVDAFDEVGLKERGFALVTLDEINDIRQWIEDFKAATAAATTLANFKSGVAALPNMPDRTKAQIIPAVKSKIQGGGAD